MKYLYSLLFVFISIVLYAQPTNDDCSGVIDLGVAPVCPTTIYDNVNSTPTDVGNDNEPGCFISNPPSNDVWFQFVTDAVITDYTVTISSTEDGDNDPLDNIQYAIYRGFCSEDNLFLNNCVTGAVGDQVVELDLVNLTPSELYYIRVDNYGDNNAEGDFLVCVEEKSPDVNIDEGFSNDCTGTLYDSGGPDGNYGDNEDFTFVICPQEFHQCVTFNMEYYNIEGGFGGDNIQFFNGPDINSPQISEINGGGFDDGGGAVCYQVRADSCLTIRFTSGPNVNFEGFKADWECSINPCPQDVPLAVNEGATIEEIEAAISTPLAQVTVDTIICPEIAFGTFDGGDDTDLGMSKGLLLTSGRATNAIGPNNQGGIGELLFAPGDEDLDILSDLYDNGQLSNDACVIEVDVTVYAEELNFEYIFGSEEYPEFVNSFNDIFALLIEGPGIPGIPELNGKDNMAVIPGTDQPISINTVNNFSNWEYYRNNDEGQSLQYDGLTSGFLGNKKSLTASAIVQPCSTYHLKFAVADRGDSAFDSGVFISEIRSGTPQIGTKFTSGLDYFVEKCLGESTDTIIIFLDTPVDETTEYTVVVSGTATQPDDFILGIPDTIIFGAGQVEAKFPIDVFDDAIVEGDETVIIKLFRDFGCGDVEVASTEVFIRENIKVEIDVPQDTIIVCEGNFVSLEASGATSYTWSPFNVFDNPFISNPTVEAGYTGWVYVEGKIDPFTDPACIGLDSVYINNVDPIVEIVTDDSLQICVFDTITLTAINNIDDSNISWSDPFGFLNGQTGPTVDYVPNFGFVGFEQLITVTVELNGCIAQDEVTVFVDPFTVIQPLVTDTVICQDTELQLNQQGFSFNGTLFEWNPEDFLSDPLDPFTTSIPEEDISYELYVTSPSGFCADTFQYNIEIIPNEISIQQGDSLRLCLGDTLDLNAIFQPFDATLAWEPAEFVEVTGDGSVRVFPNVTTDFIVNSDNGICASFTEFRVYVDSLPDMPIEAIPVRDPYCKGETITFTSPGYKNFQYPLIEHLWDPALGLAPNSSTSDYNIVLGAEETLTYIRTTTNGACSVEDSISINVIDPSIEILLNDTLICEGEDIQYDVMANGELDEIEWSSDSGEFSCDDCPDPLLSNITDNTVVTINGDVDGCPTSASMNVEVLSYDGNITTMPDTACNFYGNEIILTANVFPNIPEGSTLTWFSPEGEIEGVTNDNPITITLPGSEDANAGETFLNYYWTIVDMMGCTGSGGLDVCVRNRFQLPNAFSPGNNDGNNDVFRVVDFGKGLTPLEVKDFSVFNRWGQRVYLCEDFQCATETGWNGRFNNVAQPGGTYFYRIVMQYADGSEIEWKGDLLLLR